MESPKIIYKYYSNPAFCNNEPNQKRVVTPRRVSPLGSNAHRKDTRILRTDISDNHLRVTRCRDTPPALPPKPTFQRHASLMCKQRSYTQTRRRSEDLEMAQFEQRKHSRYVYDEDFSPTKKRIIEADQSEIDEYNVDAPDCNELKAIPSEIVKTVNGKTLRYAIVPDEDAASKIATQKLHELLSTPRKVRESVSPMRRQLASTPIVTPSKSCVNLTVTPRAQQRLDYGMPVVRHDVFVGDKRDRTTAVIIPRVAEAPSTYSDDTYKSINSVKQNGAAASTIAALMLTLCGGLTTGLSFYMMYSIGRRYYLDFGVLSGFTCFLLGLLGLRTRRNQLLPNRNYVSGYIVLSSFSLLSAFGLLLLLCIQPVTGTALNDITSGAVCSTSVLSLCLSTVGILASYCCARDPPDNRVGTARWY